MAPPAPQQDAESVVGHHLGVVAGKGLFEGFDGAVGRAPPLGDQSQQAPGMGGIGCLGDGFAKSGFRLLQSTEFPKDLAERDQERRMAGCRVEGGPDQVHRLGRRALIETSLGQRVEDIGIAGGDLENPAADFLGRRHVAGLAKPHGGTQRVLQGKGPFGHGECPPVGGGGNGNRAYLGAITMIIWRPSSFGNCSTLASSSTSSRTRSSTLSPSS